MVAAPEGIFLDGFVDILTPETFANGDVNPRPSELKLVTFGIDFKHGA